MSVSQVAMEIGSAPLLTNQAHIQGQSFPKTDLL